MASNLPHQINEHGDVQDQCDAFRDCRMMDEFVNLQRKERSCCNGRKIFGPAFAKREARSFGQKNSGIYERAHAEFP